MPGLRGGEQVDAPAALLAPAIVLRVHEPVRHPGVGDDEPGRLEGERHEVVGQPPGVEEHRVPLLRHAGDELVHDAALHADELVLGVLREPGELLPAHLDAEGRLHGEGGGHLEGGRRGEPRPLRNVAVDREVHPPELVTALDELVDDPLRVVGPAVLLAVLQDGQRRALAVLVVHGVEVQLAVGPAGNGHPDGEVDRHREHVPLVVVGVLANEVHAAGSRGDHLGLPPVLLRMALLDHIH